MPGCSTKDECHTGRASQSLIIPLHSVECLQRVMLTLSSGGQRAVQSVEPHPNLAAEYCSQDLGFRRLS